MKVFYPNYNVGEAKYVVNHHDGVKTHKDGSPFYDIALFSNMRKFENFMKGLIKKGYKLRSTKK